MLTVFFLVPAWSQPAEGSSRPAPTALDIDRNGIEDILDRWLAGEDTWEDLRLVSRHSRAPEITPSAKMETGFSGQVAPASGSWAAGQVRIIVLGNSAAGLAAAHDKAARAGDTHLLHNIEAFGGVQVVALEEAALRAFLSVDFDGRVMLDRDGLPALVQSRSQVGGDQVATGHWKLGRDWSATVAILDSGCDTAHGDLGDVAEDNVDGPPPAVGDATDWFSAANGWPLSLGYTVVGWHDVTDDFPLAQGPWDYHHHGTELASVVAGTGAENPNFRGLNPNGRLTVVKYYDFDEVWHAWAGDYLAACAWVLANHETYRIRTALSAVNWEVDLGITEAMDALVNAGILPVAAMGNFGEDATGPGFPACLPSVLTAGSTDPDGAVSSFSGRGLPGQAKPDLLAPGGGVTTADNEPDDTYTLRQGTSLAAAHVAGAAYLLEEALVDNGIHLPADRQAVQTRMALLRATAARVDRATEVGGGGTYDLPPHDSPDVIRGWGLLRVDAAVRAALQPLLPGIDQQDTLSLDFQRPGTARRLSLSPGVRYRIQVVPQAGLDIAVDVIDPRELDNFPFGLEVARINDYGPGGLEYLYHTAPADSWSFVVIRQVSGSGSVTLSVEEADLFSETAVLVQLPGLLSAPPNVGNLVASSGPTIVVPSLVDVDSGARSVNVLDSAGHPLVGWPVFVFPHSSARGGLSQPVVWNLDGAAGDEIVFSADFGSVYFFNKLGGWFRVELAFNIPLTTPVGVEEPSGERKIVVLDQTGILRSWSWGPVLEETINLGQILPLDPAVGQIVAGDSEELAIAFSSGVVLVTDSAGNALPGWPVDLGVTLETPPVLCDLDEDGLHEIILPDLDVDSGVLRMYVLTGSGAPGPGNGTALIPPSGGNWLKISDPVVAGRYSSGDLRVSVTGLASNGLGGSGARWVLARASLLATGAPDVQALPGLEIHGTTSQGVLTIQRAILPNPLAYDFRGGIGTEEATLFSLDWTELLYGLTSINGSTTAWFRSTNVGRPLEGRVQQRSGGSPGTALTVAGGLFVDLDAEVGLQVQVLDNTMNLIPILAGHGLEPAWASARADQRNSGAYPLHIPLAPVPEAHPVLRRLSIFPNPGSDQFCFQLEAGRSDVPVGIKVYDLRGRHIKSFKTSAGELVTTWDGSDERGRPVAAGSYLAVARQGSSKTVTRFVVTR